MVEEGHYNQSEWTCEGALKLALTYMSAESR